MADIGADDQQHDKDRAHQQAQHRPNRSDDLFLKRNCFERLVLVIGISGLQLARKRGHLGVQL